jgi:zinc/manganese transport system substrate-binding protein
MSLRRLRFAPAAALAALALTAAGCGSAEPGDAAAGSDAAGSGAEPIKVVTSTDVYGSVAQAVGGDRVEVVSIIDAPGLDPHEYEATPADAAEVADAAIVIGNGGGYDPFVPQLVESAGGQAHLIDVYEISGVEEGGAHGGEDAPPHGEDAHAHGEANEHLWYELPAMQALADAIAAELGEVSPDDAQTFTTNAASFNEEVDGLQEKLASIRAANEGARVAVTEPLPVYLLEDAGLVDVTPEEFSEAIEEGTDPSAAALQQTLELFSGDPVEALILNSQTQSAVTDQVRQTAEAAGVPVVEMGETLAEGATDYISWMESQIDALATALTAAP